MAAKLAHRAGLVNYYSGNIEYSAQPTVLAAAGEGDTVPGDKAGTALAPGRWMRKNVRGDMNMSGHVHWFRVPLSRRRFLEAGAAAGIAAAGLPRIARAATPSRVRGRSYADWAQVDPAFSTGVTEEEVHALIYNKLIQYTPGRKWGWQLDAAAEIAQTDPTHIRFTLRRGIGWSNGFGELTAADVKFSFERIVDPELKASNRPDWGSLDRVEVHDDRSGVIVFKEPFQPVWNITLPYISGNIVSRKAVEAAGGKLGAEAPTVSGPYRVREHRLKERTVLERNPGWQGPKTDFDEIEIFPIDDENTAQIAYEAGDIDFTRVSLASIDKLKADPPTGSTVEVYPSLYYVWVGMNMENPKLTDIRVRQAVQYAIDVPSIVEAAYFGVAEPSTGIIAPGLIGHRAKSLVPPQANIAKARDLLAEAGVDGLALTLDVLNKSANVTAAQVIQATCAQAGITIDINLRESGDFWTLGDASKGDQWKKIELILNRFSMTPDPYYATAWFTCEQVGIWNWERFCNPEFDALHKKAMAETDTAKRAKMYERMQDLMEQSGAYRFITHEATPVIYRDTIRPALRPDGLPLYRFFAKA